MKVTILGTANAWGPNPLLNAPWPMTGSLSDGRKIEIRRYRTAFLIETADGKKILVDCGPDFSHQFREFRIGVIDAILVTHPHYDHVGGLHELSLYKATGCLPMPMYATSAAWTHLKDDLGVSPIVGKLVTEMPLTFGQALKIGSLTITPFQVEHHAIDGASAGFVFEENGRRLLYTGDFRAVSNPDDALFKQSFDHVIMECDRFYGLAGPGIGGNHNSFEEAVQLLTNGVFSAPAPKQVTFVHFGDHGPKGLGSTYQDWRENMLAGLQANGLADVMPDADRVVAYEGMVIEL